MNRLSTIADHTSYWNVPNDFVSAVAGQIRSWANWSSAPWSVDLGRHGRMRWRRAVGVLLGVGAIAVFWRAGSPLRDSVLVPAWDLLKIDPASTTGQIVAHFGLQPLAIGAAGLAINLALVLAYGRFVLDPCWNAWERSRQRRRPDAFEGAQSFPQFVARWLHRTGGCARAGVCALVATVPLLILAQIVRHGGFMPAVGSLLQIGEFIRGAFAWLLMGATLLGVVGFVWQGWEALQAWRQRRRAGE